MAVTEKTDGYLDLTRLQAQLPLSVEAMKKPNGVHYNLDVEMGIAEVILKAEVDLALAKLASTSLYQYGFSDYMGVIRSIVQEAESEHFRHREMLLGRTGKDDDDLPF